MYKNLTPEELKMIKQGMQKDSPAPKKLTVLANLLIWAAIFLLFTVVGFLIVSLSLNK